MTQPVGPGPDVFAANPVVDKWQAIHGHLVALARRTVPAPTLFEGGDLPPFTASGMDVAVLRRLPWQARHPAARAGSLAAAYKIVEECSGPDGDMMAAMLYARDVGNVDYDQRVVGWLVGAGVTPDTQHEVSRGLVDASSPVAAARRKDNDVYDALFGDAPANAGYVRHALVPRAVVGYKRGARPGASSGGG